MARYQKKSQYNNVLCIPVVMNFNDRLVNYPLKHLLKKKMPDWMEMKPNS